MDVSDVACTHRRLGKKKADRLGRRHHRRLLTIRDKEVRARMLANTSCLKTSDDNYSKVYVKRDVHPSIRKEWLRLRDAEAREKERLENVVK